MAQISFSHTEKDQNSRQPLLEFTVIYEECTTGTCSRILTHKWVATV